MIILLAGLIPLGLALETTGLAQAAADWLLRVAGPWGDTVVFSLFVLLAVGLTGVMSNNANSIGSRSGFASVSATNALTPSTKAGMI